MTMTKSLILLALTLVSSTEAVPDPKKDECKWYSYCCDNDICTNNCEMIPEYCDNYSFTIDPSIFVPNAITNCEHRFKYKCCREASGCGDPHFTLWNGDAYDFHGECDLVFVHAPSFGHGMGMDVHVRTKIRSDFSYIEAVAVKIGADVFEVGAWGMYLINGVESTELENLAAFPITHSTIDEATHNYEIFIGEGDQKLHIKSFKDYVSVKFVNVIADDFRDSQGMLGDFLTGKRLARDGQTLVEDDIAFGMEWQVRPEEPQLFQSNDLVPQFPDKCNMPPMTADGRRLAELKVSEDEALEACSHMKFDEMHLRMCVYDVQMTGDLGMAAAAAF